MTCYRAVVTVPTVRTATPNDAPALADFLRLLGLFKSLETLTPQALTQELEQKIKAALPSSHTLLVAADETEIVGYAAVHWLPALFQSGPDGYLSELFVSAARRGEGVGSSLLRAVELEARHRGCPRLTLLNLKNRESYRRGFYAAHGFTEQPHAVRFVKSLL